MKRLLGLLLFASACFGQGSNIPNTVIQVYGGAPSGVCFNNWLAVRTDTAGLYDCLAGVWTVVAGSGSSGTVTSIATTSPITGGTITTTGTIACATCGVTGSPLSQFAATTSAQLAGVLTNETGTGLAVFNTSPTFVTPILGTPTSGTLTNATGLPVGGISATGTPSSSNFLRGDGAWATPAGSGNVTAGTLTSGTVPVASGATAIQDSLLTENGTTLAYSGTGGGNFSAGPVASGSDGVHAGYASVGGNTTAPTIPANSFAWIGPNSASFTKYGIQCPATAPSATSYMQLAAVASNLVACSYVGVTGTGSVVQATSPTLVTPTIGVATATSVNKMAITAPATSSTLAVADGKTATFSNSITIAGTDSTTMTFPSTSATISRTVASGAKALATGAISSAACTTAQTDTATGTLTTDAIIATFNGDPTAVTGYVPLTSGMLTIIVYPTADTVNFKVCNNTSGSITPGAVTLNWRVVR